MTRTTWLLALSICVASAACSDSRRATDAGAPDGAVEDSGDGSSVGGGGKGAGGKNAGSSGANGASGAGAHDGGAQAAGDAAVIGATDPNWTIPKELQLCGGPCACADGIDNDGDGTADGFDIECSGPGDDDEGSFATGIPGDNKDPKWQDCFFDGNSGGGDDGCRYSTKCLTGELPQDDKNCTLAQDCIDFCRPRAPNGCDCFGCCEVYKPDGTSVHVVLSAACDADDLDACQTCVPSTDCSNDCGECELCAGKTAADLPASCSDNGGSGGHSGSGGMGGAGGMDGAGGSGAGGNGGTGGGPGYKCDDGEVICTSNADCKDTFHYCTFGCCVLAGPD